jgi:drug/metabolite transporter (DMT)-like permease
MSAYARGLLYLNLVTLLWGTTFVVVKDAVETLAPSALVFLRFLLAALFFLPWSRVQGGVLWAGLELAFWLLLGYATQAIGLQYTSASRSAFITALNVVLVPLLLSLVGRRPGRLWVAALLAFLGVGLLSYDPRQPPLNAGDAWTLATALTYALYILRLEVHARLYPPLPLTAVQLWGTALLALLWMGLERPSLERVPWGAVVYLGLIATALTTWLQTLGQGRVPALQAAVIYTMEPVWATLFAWALLGERIGLMGAVGGALVLLATLWAQIPTGPLRRRD